MLRTSNALDGYKLPVIRADLLNGLIRQIINAVHVRLRQKSHRRNQQILLLSSFHADAIVHIFNNAIYSQLHKLNTEFFIRIKWKDHMQCMIECQSPFSLWMKPFLKGYLYSLIALIFQIYFIEIRHNFPHSHRFCWISFVCMYFDMRHVSYFFPLKIWTR